ncbi:shikimate dehydrogenase, putative [Plasmodium malariae]|uniref:Shikimate dehydrogenase, putative n=1 Tax=Plasmodium malariae TaxID=5858 RepID=A0A1C3L1R1_PLAMA|nr:shikimate dehydrogenase, putative [Plasmodium malariae]
MYLNGFIIGYVFRHEINKKFYLHKNDNIIFHYIKTNVSSKTNNNNCKNSFFLMKNILYNHKKTSLNKMFLYVNGYNQNYQNILKFLQFSKLLNLKKNIQVSNFVAFRLSFWTCFCTLSCWQLNKNIENTIVSSMLSGFIASSFNKLVFREYQRVLIPSWFGCILR